MKSDDLADCDTGCVDSETKKKHICAKCGFATVWTPSLRCTLESHLSDSCVTWKKYCYEEVSPDKTKDRGDEAYGEKKKKRITLVDKKGTVVDFLDSFEAVMYPYVQHRVILAREHRSRTQFELHRRPGILERNIDYGQNGTVENARQIQSEHWNSTQYTLFGSVVSYACVKTWMDKTSTINTGVKVIVYGEMPDEDINTESFPAVVTCVDNEGRSCVG